MKKLNIRPALKMRLADDIKGLSTFYIVMVLVYAAVMVLYLVTHHNGSNSESSMSAYGLAGSICLFVTGICTVREHLRLCLQHGAGRGTAFVSEVISTIAVCLLLSAAGEVLLALFQLITKTIPNLSYSDIYQLMYVGFSSRSMTAVQHLESIFFNFSLMLCANMVGMLISLVFFRLNKIWTVIVAVGVPLLWMFGLPIGINVICLSEGMQSFFYNSFMWIVASALHWIVFFVAVAAVIAFINWLIMRKAPLKVSK